MFIVIIIIIQKIVLLVKRVSNILIEIPIGLKTEALINNG